MDDTSLFYSVNGTLHVVNVMQQPRVAEAIIVIICYLIGVGYNFIVAIAVLYNNKLRTCPFYVLLLQMCVICLLDCLANESIAFGFLLNSGGPSCRFSAAVFHFFLLSHTFSLGLILLERSLSLKDHSLTARIALGGILLSWVLGLVFVLPISAIFRVHYFPYRNACSFVKVYVPFSALSLSGFLLVWGLMAICVFELISFVMKYLSDRKQLTVLSIFPLSNSAIQNPVLPAILCSKNKIVFTLTFLYSVLLLPLTISYSVTIFLTPVFKPNPWIDPRIPTNDSRPVLTNPLEPLFTYSRYIYNAVVPIVILSSDREIRLRSRQVFCYKRNLISSVDQSIINSQNMVYVGNPSTISVCGLKTPVLFSTSKGLHLRNTENMQTKYRGNMSGSKSKLRLITTFCDLTINSTDVEVSSYSFSQTVRVSAGRNVGHVRDKRSVRFSSQVDAISAPHSRLSTWSSADTAGQSDPQTVAVPLLVKSEDQKSNSVGDTYTKM